MATDRSRTALLVVSLATGMSLFGDTAMYTVLPSKYQAVGITLVSVGVLLSVNRFIRVFLNGPMGYLTDRWPRRRVFVPAVFLGAVSTASYALSTGFVPFLAGRLLWGLAWSGIWVAGNAIVLDISNDRDRGRLIGRYQIAFFLGAAGGSILGGLLTDLTGFRPAMAIASALTLSGAVGALIFLPETSSWRSRPQLRASNPGQQRLSTDIAQLTSATMLLGVNRLVIAGTLIATLGRYMVEIFGETVEVGSLTMGVATVTGLALGFSTLVGMVAAPMAGRISDNYESRWSTVGGGLSFGVAGFGLLAVGTPMALAAGLPMASISSGSNQSLSTALVGDVSPGFRHGRRLGVLFTVGDLASAVGPPVAYALLPVIGLNAIYGACSLILGAMLVVAVYWSRRTKSGLVKVD